MPEKDPVCWRCRYGQEAKKLWGSGTLIFCGGESGYQGYASLLSRLPDSRFVYYTWTYGSCSGCDDWENRDLTSEQIMAEMTRDAAYFDRPDQVRSFFKLEGDYYNAPVPSSSPPTNGSVPGMLYTAFGGFKTAFEQAGAAFDKWQRTGLVTHTEEV